MVVWRFSLASHQIPTEGRCTRLSPPSSPELLHRDQLRLPCKLRSYRYHHKNLSCRFFGLIFRSLFLIFYSINNLSSEHSLFYFALLISLRIKSIYCLADEMNH